VSKADKEKSPPLDLGKSSPLVPPLYQSSVYTLPDLDTLDLITEGGEAGFIYARDGHPNARMLAEQVAALEKAEWAVMCGSGMAAISATLLANLQQGDRIVASHWLYGKTLQLLRDELPRYGIETTFVDTCEPEQVRQALHQRAKVLLVETLSNPLLRTVDLKAMVQLTRSSDCLLIVDNTFATPELVRPVELGAKVVIESLTKMMGGHADVTLGVVCGTGDLGTQLPPLVSMWGFAANPFDCWLAERGLATLSLRMRQASATALALADWLASRPGIARVVYPGLPDHPDHTLAQEQFHGCFGNMLCFELKGGRAAVNRFLKLAPEIPFSPSLGNVSTTLSHPATTSHRYVSPAERKRQGITDGLIRLSVGIEALDRLQEVFTRGLS
jgi:cystathionine beta-lyase/cystathionine gamma-synthase